MLLFSFYYSNKVSVTSGFCHDSFRMAIFMKLGDQLHGLCFENKWAFQI